MKLKPESLKEWGQAIALVVGLMTASAGSLYGFGIKTGLWGGQIENVNRILAQEHIGETPTTEVIVVNTDTDFQAVKVYPNDDTLYFRRYEDQNGKMQRINRWTSKRSIESIIESGNIKFPTLINSAYAQEKPKGKANKIIKEIYIGKTAEGFSVYRIEWLKMGLTCMVLDEGTGEIIDDDLPVPCEQYIN